MCFRLIKKGEEQLEAMEVEADRAQNLEVSFDRRLL